MLVSNTESRKKRPTKIKPTMVEPVASGALNGTMSSDVIPKGEARHCGHFRAVWRASVLLTID